MVKFSADKTQVEEMGNISLLLHVVNSRTMVELYPLLVHVGVHDLHMELN
jgi:hypothetical protein